MSTPATLKEKKGLKPSEFAQTFLRLPIRGELQPFSLDKRPYLPTIYNSAAKKVLLMFGRQSEKSTTLGNQILADLSMRRFFKVIYVVPRRSQASDFSKDRIKQPLEWSIGLNDLQINRGARDNTFFKEFLTGSHLRVLSAYLSADALRGKAADKAVLDEVQNILVDNLAIVEECLFHSDYQIFRYAGTPLTQANSLGYMWAAFSTQNEWMIPCDRCGGGDYRFWNAAGEANIGPVCLVCARCKEAIDPCHSSAQWVSMNPDPGLTTPFEGYRVPQIITPMVDWPELLDKKRRYPRFQFMNEVLAMPYDVGVRPITQEDLRVLCLPELSFLDRKFPKGPTWLEEFAKTNQVFAGVDWGTGENSYSVLSLCTYLSGYLTYFYFHRFEGEETELRRQMAVIEEIFRRNNVCMAGADYGGGFDRNPVLAEILGTQRVLRYQYAYPKQFAKWEPTLNRYVIHRSEVMACLFNAIRQGAIRLPRWEEFKSPFATDCLAVTAEWNDAMHLIQFDKSPNSTDDTFHSMVYAFLASLTLHPRPDLIHGGQGIMQKLEEQRRPVR